jgi:hypothetical protein
MQIIEKSDLKFRLKIKELLSELININVCDTKVTIHVHTLTTLNQSLSRSNAGRICAQLLFNISHSSWTAGKLQTSKPSSCKCFRNSLSSKPFFECDVQTRFCNHTVVGVAYIIFLT